MKYRKEARRFKESGIDNPFVPLHDLQQKRNAASSAGGKATARSLAEPVVFDAERALAGFRRLLGEVYS